MPAIGGKLGATVVQDPIREAMGKGIAPSINKLRKERDLVADAFEQWGMHLAMHSFYCFSVRIAFSCNFKDL